MAANYLHGVETVEVNTGTRPVQVVKSSVIALVGIAPQGAVNEPTLVLSERDAAQFGQKVPGFSIPKALSAIFAQGQATVVVVNTFDKLKNTEQVYNESQTISNSVAKLAYAPAADLVLTNAPTVTGETKATGTLTVADKGTDGVTTYIYANDPFFGYFLLAAYTKVNSDDTTAKVATAIGAAINAGTAQSGYSASVTGSVVTVTTRAGLGTTMNDKGFYLWNPGGGLDITAANFSGGAAGSAVITQYELGVDYSVDTLGNITVLSGSAITEGATIKASYKKLDAGSVTAAQIIGTIDSISGAYSGIKCFDLLYNTFGFTPKILIAPGYSQLDAVGQELLSSANKHRAIALLDAPEGTTVTQAIAGRGPNGSVGGFYTSSKRAYLMYPMVKVYDAATDSKQNEPLSQFAAGVMSVTDLNDGYWFSPSNREILGIVGMERTITGGINNPSSEANLLNEKGICTLQSSFGTGIRLWGNRSAAFPSSTAPDNFISVRRTADIIQESIEYAMLDFIDRPINKAVIDAITETVNQFMRTLIGRGALIDGNCTFNPAKNSETELAAGHLVFDIDFMPPTPAERITFDSFIDISLLKQLTATA